MKGSRFVRCVCVRRAGDVAQFSLGGVAIKRVQSSLLCFVAGEGIRDHASYSSTVAGVGASMHCNGEARLLYGRASILLVCSARTHHTTSNRFARVPNCNKDNRLRHRSLGSSNSSTIHDFFGSVHAPLKKRNQAESSTKIQAGVSARVLWCRLL